MDSFDLAANAIGVISGFFGAWLFYNKGRFKHFILCLKYDRKRAPCVLGWHKWETELCEVEGFEFTPQGIPTGEQINKKAKVKRCKICPAIDTSSLKIDKGLSVVKDKNGTP